MAGGSQLWLLLFVGNQSTSTEWARCEREGRRDPLVEDTQHEPSTRAHLRFVVARTDVFCEAKGQGGWFRRLRFLGGSKSSSCSIRVYKCTVVIGVIAHLDRC